MSRRDTRIEHAYRIEQRVSGAALEALSEFLDHDDAIRVMNLLVRKDSPLAALLDANRDLNLEMAQ